MKKSERKLSRETYNLESRRLTGLLSAPHVLHQSRGGIMSKSGVQGQRPGGLFKPVGMVGTLGQEWYGSWGCCISEWWESVQSFGEWLHHDCITITGVSPWLMGEVSSWCEVASWASILRIIQLRLLSLVQKQSWSLCTVLYSVVFRVDYIAQYEPLGLFRDVWGIFKSWAISGSDSSTIWVYCNHCKLLYSVVIFEYRVDGCMEYL